MSMERKEVSDRQIEMQRIIIIALTNIQRLYREDEFNFCALLAAMLGEQLACKDDMINPDLPSDMEKDILHRTFQRNFDEAYKEHKLIHARIAAGKDAGEAMFKDVCEAYSESRKKPV